MDCCTQHGDDSSVVHLLHNTMERISVWIVDKPPLLKDSVTIVEGPNSGQESQDSESGVSIFHAHRKSRAEQTSFYSVE